MLLQPIADHLRATATAFRKVAGAANFAAVKDDIKGEPNHAYVIPMSGNAQPNTLLGYSVSQKVSEGFAVIVAVDNKRDVRGDAVNAPLETARRATLDALLGFLPAAGYDPITLGSEQLLELDVTTIFWQIGFNTGYFETKV
jgi:hypothetical protein